MYVFCTYFDHHYLPRGLALYDSLKQHCAKFELWVLSQDEECTKTLLSMNLPELRVVDIQDLEGEDAELLEARKDRTLIEFYFTCTPSWLLYVMKRATDGEIVTYLDADLFFFSDPAALYEEFGTASIGIIRHGFPPQLKELERFGIFNVGYLSFRRDQNGEACLRWWRDRCLEWCHDYVEGTRFADQKYLDDWPSRFQGVHVFRQKGACPGPWNIGSASITEKNHTLLIDSQPLIAYHFHGLKIVKPYLYEAGLSPYGSHMVGGLKKIYAPYLRNLRRRLTPAKQVVYRYRKDHAHLYSKLAHSTLVLFFHPLLFEIHFEPIVEPLLRIKRALYK